MNWLKRLWSWLVRKTSTAPELAVVEVEEVELRSASSIFGTLCRAAGVKQKDLDASNAIELFDEWYNGEITEEDIKQSIAEFKVAHPVVNAKLSGKI